MRKWKLCRLLLLSLSLLYSCNYQWQQDDIVLSVPIVAGDEDGLLTAEIIKALAHSGQVRLVNDAGDYCLKVAVANNVTERIGYRRDPQKIEGKVKKQLLASEGRRMMTVEVSLFEGDDCIFGPNCISAEADYDFVDGDSLQDLAFVDSQGQVQTVLPFSLGQLEPIEAAQEAAARPLYKKLAQKIADVVLNR